MNETPATVNPLAPGLAAMANVLNSLTGHKGIETLPADADKDAVKSAACWGFRVINGVRYRIEATPVPATVRKERAVKAA